MMGRSAGAVLLETERLVLRHFTMADAGNLADLDADPDVMRFITGGLATSREEIQDNLLPGFMAWYRRPGGYGWRMASSYRSDLVIARQWTETASAAAHVAATLPADVKVATQGHVLVAGDFLATLAVEATIHHLDLAAGDESLAGPSGPGLAAVRTTLDGALGQPVPVSWDDVDYVLKGTGRAELSAGDRASLGVLAARFPLLG